MTTARNRRRKAGNEILSGDFLAPVLAAWISRDVPLGVVPLNVVLRNIGIHADDRAVALEKAWEASWSMKLHDDFLGRNFLAFETAIQSAVAAAERHGRGHRPADRDRAGRDRR